MQENKHIQQNGHRNRGQSWQIGPNHHVRNASIFFFRANFYSIAHHRVTKQMHCSLLRDSIDPPTSGVDRLRTAPNPQLDVPPKSAPCSHRKNVLCFLSGLHKTKKDKN